MSKSTTYEYVFADTYPSGAVTPSNTIDDVMRYIKEAQYARFDQEHFWRHPADTGYTSAAEGAHRPASARVWAVGLDDDSLPAMPTYASYLSGSFHIVSGDPDVEPDDLAGQWKGTAWWNDDGVMRPLLSRFRGKLRIAGCLHVMPEMVRWEGATVGTFSVAEHNATRTTSAPAFSSDNITLYPFYQLNAAELGADPTDYNRLITFPLRVGKFAPADNTFTAPGATEPSAFAVALDNWPAGDGVLVAFTPRGVEFYGSGSYATQEDVRFNGIKVRQHDHSGGAMGAQLALANIISDDLDSRLTWYKRTVKSVSAITSLTKDSWRELNTGLLTTDCFPEDDVLTTQTFGFNITLSMGKSAESSATADWAVALGIDFASHDGAGYSFTGFKAVFPFRLITGQSPYNFQLMFVPGELSVTDLSSPIKLHLRRTGDDAIATTPIEVTLRAFAWRH